MQAGFIGLGIMGGAMAANLLSSGVPVTVWNRTPDKCEPLRELGAKVATSPGQVVRESDITISMLADPAAINAVFGGADGVEAAMEPGKGYIEMSTIDPATSRELARRITEKQGRYLEAPVSGSLGPAKAGKLVIMAAGDIELLEKAMPLLTAMGKRVKYLGAVGNAAIAKLAVNMIMGGMLTALCEGLKLSEQAGLQVEDVLDILADGAMASPMVTDKGGRIVKGDFTPAFPLKHLQKDMRLTLALTDELQQPLLAAAIVNSLLQGAVQAGYGDQDISALYQIL